MPVTSGPTCQACGKEMISSPSSCDCDRVEQILNKWTRPDHIRLHAGEMTVQELRTVVAVVKAIAVEIGRSV